MAWTKLDEETCSSTVTVLTTSVFTPSKNIMAISHTFDTASANTLGGFRLGKTSIDPNDNYAYRSNQNFGSDNPQHTQNRIQAGIDGGDQLTVTYLYNISTEEKLSISNTVSRSGATAGYAPQSMECVGKWVNSNQADIYQQYSGHIGGGTRHIGSDSNLSILGSDGVESMTVQDGAIFHETDTNKSYVLYNGSWTEL